MDEPRAGLAWQPGSGLVHPERVLRASDWFRCFRLLASRFPTQPEGRMLNLDQFMNIRFLQKQGHSVREIARLTGHSRNTVRNHVATLYGKIGVNRRSAAVVWGRERGMVGY